MRILVLGGAGFLGAPLVARLAASGHAVTVVHRGPRTPGLAAGVHLVEGDRDDPGILEKSLRGARPDAVVDLLAHSARRAEHLVTIFGGRVPRVVVTSSVDVYRAWARFQGLEPGPPDPTPIGLDAPLRESRFPRRGLAEGPEDWRWDYDKLDVEACLRAATGLQTVILRLPYVWGPGDARHRLAPYLAPLQPAARRVGLPAPRARWRCTRAYVAHAAGWIATAVTDPAPEPLQQVGDPEPLSELDWCRAVAKAVGWAGELVVTPAPGSPGSQDWSQELVLALPPQPPVPQEWLVPALRMTLGDSADLTARTAGGPAGPADPG